ncbi:MAG TPA: glutamyl-tRNA amidotransferase [Treponema sp.]|jgi:aspartyl-tRNA(Asn)/glutamyl-tRNA(Gln) amidotransferase subunit B|nr:glutamyl-tRNA amidotransferase [Treponema sp.]HCA20381.1 glutamyl-tRNA amidotransferase [Treponema sp.]
MYKPLIYLEVRVLLSALPGVFIADSDSGGAKDILTAKAEFQKRNNSSKEVHSVEIQSSVLHKAAALVRAMGGSMEDSSQIEKLTAHLPEPPDDRNFKGFSVKVASNGSMDISFHQKAKKITIEEYRIEESTGHLTRSGGKAHMDWTYAGCPILRLRTSPVFEVGEEAELFLEELYTLMAYLKLITGDLAENSMRCNAYVALTNYPEKNGAIVKLRNLNSFNFVRKAINSELTRQEDILETGGTVESESRLWIEERTSTEPWQERGIQTVRFEPLNPAVTVDLTNAGSPALEVELPAARRNRIQKNYGLSRLRAQFICREKDRADYFEAAVNEGSSPLPTARWIAGELTRLLKEHGHSIKQTRITPSRFAGIISMLEQGKISSGIAKDLLQRIYSTGETPEDVVKNEKWTLLSTEQELMPSIERALEQNPKSAQSLKNGDMAPLDHLTGFVMKETGGRADPTVVKSLIKHRIHISVVYVLTMGGTITAQKLPDGTLAAGNPESIRPLTDCGEHFPVKIIPVCGMLSEETEPRDWASLIAEIKERMESGTANGIVVTHGTDTLPYTAALLFWLFGSADVPIVLTASTNLPEDGEQAKQNLSLALKTAREQKKGVFVAYNGELLSPLNLKFIGKKDGEFRNWNMKRPVFTYEGGISGHFQGVTSPDRSVMAQILNEAASSMISLRLYPGLAGKHMERLIARDSGISTVILELYASGTGNMRNSDYSLKPLLLQGRKSNVRFYCTSQQECSVDFSEYSTSANVWREGAVPMGSLTTESVTALYFASSLISDTAEELENLMETAIYSV